MKATIPLWKIPATAGGTALTGAAVWLNATHIARIEAMQNLPQLHMSYRKLAQGLCEHARTLPPGTEAGESNGERRPCPHVCRDDGRVARLTLVSETDTVSPRARRHC
jgi:hypothetical protein